MRKVLLVAAAGAAIVAARQRRQKATKADPWVKATQAQDLR